MDSVYTQKQVEDTWIDYQQKTVLRVLKDGKWKVYDQDKIDKIDGTRAEIVKLKTVLSFPAYLKRVCSG